jgi:filamentous hemagglutinin family protein
MNYPNLLSGFLVILVYSNFPRPILAQIIPDRSLPSQSVVNSQGSVQQITGGTSAGDNLFHSFEQFNLLTGETAYFDNSPNIKNILTRVTGGQVSTINGLIQANGLANLFLINPNGIVFGANAKLNLGGSFIASTAESIKLADNSLFSATERNAPPLLTINLPIGLQFGQNTGEIRVEGTGHSLNANTEADGGFTPVTGFAESPSGLQIKPGKTFALVGGNLRFNGGILTAPWGHISLGSVGAGFVSLTPTDSGWQLGYAAGENFGLIQLLSEALVDASGDSGGSIYVQGQRLEIRDGSGIIIQNQGSQAAGNITVNTAESVQIVGVNAAGNFPSSIKNQTVGEGAGGDINISTQQLIAERARDAIANSTASAAPSGNINIVATDAIKLIDGSGIYALSLSAGNGGDVNLSTRHLTAINGSVVTSVADSTGHAGNAVINATESIELSGLWIDPIRPDTRIRPSSLSSSSFDAGNAGNLIINTARLILQDSGRVSASAFASGHAGNLIINASESIEVTGQLPKSRPSLISSASFALLQEKLQGTTVAGNAGSIMINTPRLIVSDRGLVNATNSGPGNPGQIQVNADQILVSNQGAITAVATSGSGASIALNARNIQLDRGSINASTSESGEGGNIRLNIGENLILRNNSFISTQSGTEATGGGNGGNITIQSQLLAALDNSYINANAFAGNGGNIQITTQGIFLPNNRTITASSEQGIDGIIEINTPETNPTSGLLVLPQNPVNIANLIHNGCADYQGSSFAIAGRGGLPENPTQVVESQQVWQDLRFLSSQEISEITQMKHSRLRPNLPGSESEFSWLVEATNWRINQSGNIELVAEINDFSSHLMVKYGCAAIERFSE